MQCKKRLEAYLHEHQMPIQVQQHARAFSAQKIAESEHIPGKGVAKTVIVWADNRMIALVLLASDEQQPLVRHRQVSQGASTFFLVEVLKDMLKLYVSQSRHK